MDPGAIATFAAGVLTTAGAIGAAFIMRENNRKRRAKPLVVEPVAGYEVVGTERMGPAVSVAEIPAATLPFTRRMSLRQGNYWDFVLEARRGDHIEVTLVEHRGLPFNTLILDAENLVLFHRDEPYTAAFADGGRSGYHFRWRCPRGGRWWLVVDAQHLDSPREVEIHVERRTRPWLLS